LEDLGIGGRIILKWIFRKYGESMYCIYVAQDEEKLQSVVNIEMKFRFP
jgi:hypothetical protein